MGLFDFLTDGETKTQALPSTSKTQQALEKAISQYLTSFVGKGAEAYPGQLPGTTAVPELFTQAYGQYAGQFGRADIGTAISDLISGKPAYTFDPGAVAKRWEETYSTPVMQAWKSAVVPILEEQYNIPGGFYSTRKGAGIGRAASEFYGGQVAPTLFSALQQGEQMGAASLESAAGRRQGAIGLPGQQFAEAAQVAMSQMGLDEKQLTALFNEFLRTRAEPGWAAGSGMGLATAGTVDWAVTQEPSLMSQIAPIAGMAAGGYFGGGGTLAGMGSSLWA